MEMLKDSQEKVVESTQQDTTKITCTTTVKVSAMWHFVADYLEMLNFTGAINDEYFSCSLKQLLNYVYGKIEIPQAKNILKEYVVYELEQ